LSKEFEFIRRNLVVAVEMKYIILQPNFSYKLYKVILANINEVN
jgi:hypothetical protein